MVLDGAKYVFATRSRTVIELVPPERPITRVPAALSVFRLGPSGLGFIEGSRDLRNRVWISGKKHVLRFWMSNYSILFFLKIKGVTYLQYTAYRMTMFPMFCLHFTHILDLPSYFWRPVRLYKLKSKCILDYVRYVRVMSASLSVSQEVMVVTDRVIAARLILIDHDDERVLLRRPHASKDPQGRYCQRRISS